MNEITLTDREMSAVIRAFQEGYNEWEDEQIINVEVVEGDLEAYLSFNSFIERDEVYGSHGEVMLNSDQEVIKGGEKFELSYETERKLCKTLTRFIGFESQL